LEEEAGHFQVIDYQVLGHDTIDNILGPLGPPNNRPDVLEAGEPDTASTVYAGVTISQVSGLAWDKLMTMYRAIPK
jgi:hypothetical protein